MQATRREQNSMQIDRTQRGGARAMAGRLLTAILAALALSVALSVGSASARTVYDYEYSGFYIDGGTSSKGAFKGDFFTQLSGPAYDEATETLIVPVATDPGYAVKFNKDGSPAQFTGVGSDTIEAFPAFGYNRNWSQAEIAIDNTGGSNDGNIYINGAQFGSGFIFGYKRDGTPVGHEFEKTPAEDTA